MSSQLFMGDETYRYQCHGLPCIGDEVKFSRPITQWIYSRAIQIGIETIVGKVMASSIGKKSGRHTFTIKTPSGELRFAPATTLRKCTVYRKPWPNENEREEQLMVQRYRDRKVSEAASIERFSFA